MQSSLEQVGIHTELVLQPYLQHQASVEAGEHDLCIFGWVGDTGDPDNFLYVLFHSDNAMGPDPQNVAFYRDDTVDKWLVEAQGVADEATRSGLYAAVQDKIATDAPWVPIAHSRADRRRPRRARRPRAVADRPPDLLADPESRPVRRASEASVVPGQGGLAPRAEQSEDPR